MKNTLRVRLNHTWLDQLGFGVGKPSFSTVFGQPGGSGPDEASVALGAPIGFRHPDVVEGALMRVYAGGWPVFGGEVGQIDRDRWVIGGRGHHRAAIDAINFLDGTAALSNVPDTVVDFGIARGALRRWSRPASIRSTAVGDEKSLERPSTIAALLNSTQDLAGASWHVDQFGRLTLRSASTQPDYHMIPKSIDLPVSYDDYASAVYIRYQASDTPTFGIGYSIDAAASNRYRKEYTVDATDLGTITGAEANTYADGIMAGGKAKAGYTASVETTGWQLLTKTLTPADPRRIAAGQKVRLHGVSYDGPVFQSHYDWIIGRTVYVGGEDTVLLDPLNLVSNGSLEDTVAKILGAAWNMKFGAGTT